MYPVKCLILGLMSPLSMWKHMCPERHIPATPSHIIISIVRLLPPIQCKYHIFYFNLKSHVQDHRYLYLQCIE
jgi:hypothetical protein